MRRRWRGKQPPLGMTAFATVAHATAIHAKAIADRAKAALFVCDKLEKPSPNCQSRFPLGRTAEVSYSFKRSRLGDWQNIDNGVKDLIKSFRTAARIQN